MAKEQKIIIMDEEIELEEEKFVVFPKKEWSEEDVKKYLQRRAKLLRHTPSKKEIDSDKEGPRLRRVLKMFGTYEHAILVSGLKLPPRPWSKYSDEELLDVAREWSKNNPNGKLSAFLLDNHPELPGSGIIRSRFGGTSKYFELAGVPYEDGPTPWKRKNAMRIIPRPVGAMYNEFYHQGR